MKRKSFFRRFAFSGLLLLAIMIVATIFASSTIGARSVTNVGRQIRDFSFQSKTLQQMI